MEGYGWITQPDLGTHGPQANHSGVWVACSGGLVSSNPVIAGVDSDGGHIYAGRATHDGDLMPAKVTPNHGCAFVCYGGQEISKHDYEVLSEIPNYGWIPASNGSVPPNAILIGRTRDGENLFMGRTNHNGTSTPGKIHPSHGCLYIPFGGQELSFREYEVLVLV